MAAISTYYIPRFTSDGLVEIAKFEDSDTPVAVYHIQGAHCDCHGARGGFRCKHFDVRDAWKRLKYPSGVAFEPTGHGYECHVFIPEEK